MESGDENGTLNREPDNLSSYEKSIPGKIPGIPWARIAPFYMVCVNVSKRSSI
jgi:hypothetical protein